MKRLLLILITFFSLSTIANAIITNPNIQQSGYRWRADDGNETTATWLADNNTPTVLFDTSMTIRLRLKISNTGTSSGNVGRILQYSSNNGATWTTMTNGSTQAFKYVTTPNVTDGSNTTNQLNCTSFITGKFVSSYTITTSSLAASNQTEYEWSIKATPNTLSNTTYLFKLSGLTSAPAFPAKLNTDCLSGFVGSSINLPTIDTACGNLTLDIDTGFTNIQWSNGAITQSVNIDTSGIYTVHALNSSGCTATDTINVHIDTVPYVNLGNDASICGDANQSVTLDAGSPGATYLWDNNTTNQTRTITQSGTYSVTVTNAFGCSSSDTVTKNLLLSPTVDLGNDTTICNGITLKLDATNPNSTYYWSNGATTPTIEVDQSGTYIVMVNNTNNCTTVDTINIIVSGTMPTLDAILVHNVAPYTFNFEVYNLQGAINSYTWDFGDGTPVSHQISPTHTYAQSGNYNITLTLGTPQCGNLTFTTSTHIVGINDISIDDGLLSIYPNPANNIITIDNKSNYVFEQMTIINTLGQVMYQNEVKTSITHINTSNFASGIYSLRIKTNKGFIVRKFEITR